MLLRMLTTDWTDPMRAHRVVVREPIPPGLERPRYVDAFAVRRRPGDTRPLEAVVRAAFEQAPSVSRAVFEAAFAILSFRVAPYHTPGHIGGWRIARSEPELVEIAVDGPRASSRIVMRQTDDEVTGTTFVITRGPVMAAAWTMIAPAHRRIARLLIDRGARG